MSIDFEVGFVFGVLAAVLGVMVGVLVAGYWRRAATTEGDR